MHTIKLLGNSQGPPACHQPAAHIVGLNKVELLRFDDSQLWMAVCVCPHADQLRSAAAVVTWTESNLATMEQRRNGARKRSQKLRRWTAVATVILILPPSSTSVRYVANLLARCCVSFTHVSISSTSSSAFTAATMIAGPFSRMMVAMTSLRCCNVGPSQGSRRWLAPCLVKLMGSSTHTAAILSVSAE